MRRPRAHAAPEVYRTIRHRTEPTSDLVVIKTCTYFQIASLSSDNTFSGMLDIVQPPVVQPALKQGEPRMMSVDCHRVSGKILKSVSLKIVAQQGELDTSNNSDSQSYPNSAS